HTEDGEIEDDILHEKLSKINLLIAKIKAIDSTPPESDTFCFNLEEISSGSTTTRSSYSLPDYEAFYNHIKEISSGSTTTHADFSQYDSFHSRMTNLLSWLMIDWIFEASRARGFVLRSLELHILSFILGI
ncbi:hypothetical protein Tco_0050773, partial [Tanacetum coccineum]